MTTPPKTPRAAVLFHAYEWDAYTRRQAARLAAQSAGLDFLIAANETAGPLDTAPFPKIVHTEASLAAQGLPAHPRGLWWNIDYVLYDAARQLPDHAYLLRFDPDVALSAPLAPLVSAMHEAGAQWLSLPPRGMGRWPYAATAAALPYAERRYLPVMALMFSRVAVQYLHLERLRLARAGADPWPLCECFVSSAAVDIGFTRAELADLLRTDLFRAELALLEDDERLREPGGIFHAVLDLPRYRRKVPRMVRYCRHGDHQQELARLRAVADRHGFRAEVEAA